MVPFRPFPTSSCRVHHINQLERGRQCSCRSSKANQSTMIGTFEQESRPRRSPSPSQESFVLAGVLRPRRSPLPSREPSVLTGVLRPRGSLPSSQESFALAGAFRPHRSPSPSREPSVLTGVLRPRGSLPSSQQSFALAGVLRPRGSLPSSQESFALAEVLRPNLHDSTSATDVYRPGGKRPKISPSELECREILLPETSKTQSIPSFGS
ncbi:hypothetical protein B0T21DRAFT_423063 [Apiosordaria backusii]|uniref:Uncharacterized protein n=1 Tax=Apiosordaria backusii TaxID=314023 RepID=A0AA40E0Y8_9PEZI|nr:hypothetical protein B0T21DRAFT_423063 [Apiosordaria backusii]